MDCIFCKIVNGDIPSSRVYEDENIMAFKDINPAAPVHVVIIPKRHIESANDINESNIEYVKNIFLAIPRIAQSLGLVDSGYRVVNNCGSDGGQTVKHIHYHLLGGRSLQWPPG